MGESSGKQSYISIEGGKMVRVERKKKKNKKQHPAASCLMTSVSTVPGLMQLFSLASAGLVPPCVCFPKLCVILRGGEEQGGKILRISGGS